METVHTQFKLKVDRCPHCNVAHPHLTRQHALKTIDSGTERERIWAFFVCSWCGGVVTGVLEERPGGGHRISHFPSPRDVSDAVPSPARDYLVQAKDSLAGQPAGATMLAASAVDAMLKAKGLLNGSLFTRIGEAEQKHLITAEMGLWAHEVRLEANEQRHADEATPLPTSDEAERIVEFAEALAQFLFVLPAQVKRGRGQRT